ncbi:LysR substrate-binding domain-containing protein [Variovorax sp. J22R24]|uniref:LysR substrate-binding domain-containing protein n=1 Tax=Variovorax gracilis TaxID=3053502 RepID=UPI002579136B|nr:LysR substrate-binding domain-containing protein [Variovorax sp. J22R24]MDM0106891.1 LysR substrate-binding domain-containing protein [Variovorax sp. J22R24]
MLAFEAAARRLSFTAAAVELNLTPSAVSHQIAKLEQLLGVRLFERTVRSIELTNAGREYMSRVSVALDTISSATDNVRKGVRNSLYVHAAPSFASLWLMPRLAVFAKAHPGIALSLSSSAVHSDFSSGQIDIDIRYGLPNWPHLHVQPVFEERIQPMASPAFIEQHRIETPEDLLHVPLIQSVVNVVQWGDWFRSRNVDVAVGQFAYRFDRTSMALDAAVQGLGVALDSSSIAAGHLHQGRLRKVFDKDWCVKVLAHFLVCPQRHSQRSEVANFIDWIQRSSADPESADLGGG